MDEALARIEDHVRAAAEIWRECPDRPRASGESLAWWDLLLDQWLADSELPLLIRKGGLQGVPMRHGATGRLLILCDNSPAQWAFCGAARGMRPHPARVLASLRAGTLPVVQVVTLAEKKAQTAFLLQTPNAPMGGPLNKSEYGSANAYFDGRAYKLAHIEPVGLNKPTDAILLSTDVLEAHMRRFLSPRNLFVVPKELAGLGETEAFKLAMQASS